jgi:hypothetical protein
VQIDIPVLKLSSGSARNVREYWYDNKTTQRAVDNKLPPRTCSQLHSLYKLLRQIVLLTLLLIVFGVISSNRGIRI